ncbi:hypothetical protein [Chryseobacterium indologenes]|uniref:hypothetical protein n=1 Tax=Chryseobacterium indologenes TaxID=253 RepID=UPI00301B4973
MIKSKINFESFIIIYFLTFMLSIIIPAIVYDNYKSIEYGLKIIMVVKSGFLLVCLAFIRLFFVNIHTKIIITEKDITFQKLFKSKTFNFADLNYFEKKEFAKYKSYDALLIIKENKIVERISSFDYSNYEELKKKFAIHEYKNAEISFFDSLKLITGLNVKINIKNHR